MFLQINTITIGSFDPRRLAGWYTKNFDWNPTLETDDRVCFQLNEQKLVLLKEELMASEMYMWREEKDFKNICITLGCSSLQDVDNVYQKLLAKNAMIIRKPGQRPGGEYGGCVSDPEGNFWEFCYFPLGKKYEPHLQAIKNEYLANTPQNIN
jgi:predicted lactoylglutathione lyase